MSFLKPYSIFAPAFGGSRELVPWSLYARSEASCLADILFMRAMQLRDPQTIDLLPTDQLHQNLLLSIYAGNKSELALAGKLFPRLVASS